MITLGSKGSWVFDGQEGFIIGSEPVEVVDTLGAGDMYAGAFLAGITQGLDFKSAGELASAASDKIVTEYGPRLSKKEIEKIREKFLLKQSA